MNQRELALEILYKTILEESYSNLLMRKELNKIEPQQRAFVTNLVNGVLRKYDFLQYQFTEESNRSTSLRVKLILCMALYERFMLHEKDYVVNNEYVELGKNKYEKSFINAILHKIKTLKEADEEYIRCCLPEWIYKLLSSQYSEEELEKIIEVYQQIPQICYRINSRPHSCGNLRHGAVKLHSSVDGGLSEPYSCGRACGHSCPANLKNAISNPEGRSQPSGHLCRLIYRFAQRRIYCTGDRYYRL